MSGNTLGSWYSRVNWSNRNAVFYVGDTPTLTLGKAGATAWEVRNYYGTVVASGAVSGTSVSLTPPSGGWPLGWFRVYFTGPSSDATNGNAYAGSMFSIIRPDARFPAFPTAAAVYYGNEYADPVAKGIMGLGTSRVIVNTYANPASGADNITAGLQQIAASRTYYHGDSVKDPVRERPLWCSTPSICADRRTIAGPSSGVYLQVYAATETVNGSQVFVASGPGTSSGSKIQVFAPDSTTLVETFDNLASDSAAEAAINVGSAYIRAFRGGQSTAAPTSATAIGRTVWDGIVQVVQAFWPDVQRYEFTNEPGMDDQTGHQMRLFSGAVHAGNPAAKAMGPCTLRIPTPWVTTWSGWQWCDEISFHDYNSSTCGNLAMGRVNAQALIDAISAAGLSSKPLWQTEAGAAVTGVGGVHHPRRARVKILHTLMWEQYGVPRERNPYWYDRGHGFWQFPAFWQNEDQSCTADATLHRVLAEETWAMTHQTRLAFGRVGDAIYLGSVYTGAAGSCVALIAASHMPGSTVTLTITGATGPITWVDSWGNTTATALTGGRITVPVYDTPTYVRLPVGATATVYRTNDWPPVAIQGAWPAHGPRASVAGSRGDRVEYVCNDAWEVDYGQQTYHGAYGLPDTLRLEWPSGVRVDRVVIWNAMSWQGGASLVDFDVQTSNDGTTWTTQANVTKTGVDSFLFGTNSTNTWCTRETFWDEQWIFDVKFPQGPVQCKYLRLNVRQSSFGGEPDALCVAAGGQGDSAQRISVQELAVLCDDNVNRQYVRQ